MLSMVSSNQSVGNDAASKANSNSTSTTSASMSTGNSVAHAIASLAHSGPSSPQQSENVPPQHLKMLTLQSDQTLHQQTTTSAANNAAAVLTSVSRVGMTSASQKKRSTKSKCSPGLRSGKWTAEEEAFTNMIIHYFKRGLLDVEDGTSLRWYLAKRLNCEAMRVTKKLKGNSSIGKQIFRAMENTPAIRQAIRRAREELGLLELRFLESLNVSGGGPGSQHMSSASLPSSLAVSVRGRKILPNMKFGDGQPWLAPMPQPKSEDARLLLHFFSEAHDNSDEEPEAEKKAETGSLSIDLSKKLGRKRPLSSVTTKAKTDTAKTEQKPESDEATTEKTSEPEDCASPQPKRQAVEIEKPTE